MCDLSDHQWRRDTFVHFLVISEGGSVVCEGGGEGDSLLSPFHSQEPWEVGKACVPVCVCVSVWRWKEEIVCFSP